MRWFGVKMQLGFSVVGMAFLALLFIPNVLWARKRPSGYEELARHERGAGKA